MPDIVSLVGNITNQRKNTLTNSTSHMKNHKFSYIKIIDIDLCVVIFKLKIMKISNIMNYFDCINYLIFNKILCYFIKTNNNTYVVYLITVCLIKQ